MTKTRITSLDYAILGLLVQNNLSGYAIRKAFETTALGNYSSSPGTIYPALKKLEKLALITKDEKEEDKKSGFGITSHGKEQLRLWLISPFTETDIAKHSQDLILKFAFMDYLVEKSEKLVFLNSFIGLTKSYINSLESYHAKEAGKMPMHGKLAFELGIASFKTQLTWAKFALKTIENKP